ncbi:type IV pilus biogenesis protein PilM [Pseudomonas sp. NFX1]|uniref:type IV pilus biogenesis protein PilM n=1 Tax=Pseudomonas sp. NFX1 TaxID=2201355 RepID=UPI003DA788BA
MLGRFGMDAGSLMGVEIAPDSVRVVQLQRRNGRCQVAAWAHEPYEPYSGGDWASDPVRVVGALQRACRRSGIRQRRAALALPANQVICKPCQLPAGQSEADMEAQLLADADRLFPFALEDLALDFQVLGPSKDQAGCLDVMVAACRQRSLEPIEALLDAAGLQLEVMEVDSVALQRMLPQSELAGSALLRLEAQGATLHCWQQGVPAQRRELHLGQMPGQLHAHLAGEAQLKGLLVVSSSVIEQGWLEGLSEAVNLPCRQLPLRAGLAPGNGGMLLACALASGGMRL